MATSRPGRSAKTSSQRIRRAAQPTSGRTGHVASGVVNLVTGTVMSALAGVRDIGVEVGSVAVTAAKGSIRAAGTIGADVGRLAVDVAEGAIHAADRLTAAAGRAANNLIGTTMSGVAGIVSRPLDPGSPTEPVQRPEPRKADPSMRATRKPLARSPQRTAERPASSRRRRRAG